MQLKGINPIEQHVEKGVAGLFALALLGVLAWQFLVGHAKVKVDKDEVELPEAFTAVGKLAEKSAANMNAPADPPTPEQINAVTRRFESFETALKAPVAPKDQLVGGFDVPAMTIKGTGVTGQGADTAIAEVVAPAPEHVTADTFLGTVSAGEAQLPDVAKVLPSAAPYDKAAVTVEATFDGSALRKLFETDPDADGPIRVVPKNWWENGVQILAVELHRQTLQPDGNWSAPEKVKGMPGRALNVDKADALNDAESIKEALRLASDVEMVRRTPFYDISIGEHWTPPSERDALAAAGQNKAAQVKQKRQQLANEDKRIKTIDEQLQKAGQPIGPTPGGPGGPGGRGGAPGGGGGGAAPPGNSGPNQVDEGRKKALTKAREAAVAARAQLVKDLRALGETVEGNDNGTNVGSQDQKPGSKVESPVLDNSTIHIWAHDVFVERGKTYRYQIGIVLTNPYFGHSAAMLPAQAEKLAKVGVMRSAPSDWSEPVTVDRDTYTFFVSAVEDDPTAGSKAYTRAEVYQFKWGFWRRATDQFEPGDRVSLTLSVPDYSKVLAEQPAPGADPGALPGSGRPGSGRPGGGRGAAPPSTPTQPDAPAVPAGTQIPLVQVLVPSAELILGIGHGPSRTGGVRAAEVYVREGDGAVKSVQPDLEKNDPVYVRVQKSADRGERERQAPVEKPKLPTAPGQRPSMPPGGDAPPPPSGPTGGG